MISLFDSCGQSTKITSEPSEYLVRGAADQPFLLELLEGKLVKTPCSEIDRAKSGPARCIKLEKEEEIKKIDADKTVKKVRHEIKKLEGKENEKEMFKSWKDLLEVLEIAQRRYADRTEDGPTVFASTYFPKDDEVAKLLLKLFSEK